VRSARVKWCEVELKANAWRWHWLLLGNGLAPMKPLSSVGDVSSIDREEFEFEDRREAALNPTAQESGSTYYCSGPNKKIFQIGHRG